MRDRNSIPTKCPKCGIDHGVGDGKITCHHRIFWTCHICGHKWRQGQKFPGPSGLPVGVTLREFNKDGY